MSEHKSGAARTVSKDDRIAQLEAALNTIRNHADTQSKLLHCIHSVTKVDCPGCYSGRIWRIANSVLEGKRRSR